MRCQFISDRMRLVLDTDVFAAMRSGEGASRQLLLAAFGRRIVLLASVPLMLEYEAVLTRHEHLDHTGLTVAETNAVLDAMASVIEPVGLRFHWRPQLKDLSDEMVLETAVNGRADRLATFDVRHLSKAAMTFGIHATLPGVIWREIRGAKHEKK